MKKVSLCLALALLAVALPAAAQSVEDDVYSLMVSVNAELEANDSDVRLEVVEYYTGAEEMGNVVFFNNVGNKQLAFDFIPGDPRRAPWSGAGAGDDITWASDTSAGQAAAAGQTAAATQTAISNAMATWQNANCSTLPLTANLTVGDIGVVEFIVSLGASGSPFVDADVVHGGFGTAVDVLLPPPIIAATFTFVFTTGDLDNDGLPDLAFREIYYTNNFLWDTTGGNIDVETVALHEAGHGLSQAHFGKLKQTLKNGKFHFAPRAVMNAGYTGVQRSLLGTDNAGHCSIWGSWPNN